MNRPRLISLITALALVALVAPGAQAASGKGRYIVVLKDSVASPATVAGKHSKKYDAEVKHVYKKALKGYSAKLKESELAALRADPKVAFVEADGIVTTVGGRDKGKRSKGTSSTTTYTFPTWGIDRVDQRSLPLSGSYYLQGTSQGGAGVVAYVVDTGVRFSHSEFGGRAQSGYDFVNNDPDASDCNGHGTHVAGTIGGSTYGVAKAVDIIGIRVLNCSGSGYWSGVIAGINWAITHHPVGAPAVLNMSLGGGANSSVDLAIRNAVADGITVVVAAGNSNADACRYSPAREPLALTVGATTSTDARSSYSNWGSCLDIFGPGSSIKSAWSTGDTATKTISGTSMASPHVAGVAALYLRGRSGASAAPAAVASALIGNASSGKVGNEGKNSPDLLVYADY